MTWVKIDPAPHVCSQPHPGVSFMKVYGAGSQWKCDDCHALWEIVHWVTPAGWDMLHPVWKQIS